MRASVFLPLVLAASLLCLLPPAMRASEGCSSAQSTVEETGCVIAALKAMDQRLEQALEAVAQEARAVLNRAFVRIFASVICRHVVTLRNKPHPCRCGCLFLPSCQRMGGGRSRGGSPWVIAGGAE